MTHDGQRRCRGKKKNGDPCPNAARPGRDYCFSHDPDPVFSRRRAEGQRRGGVSRSRREPTLPADTPDSPLRTVADVVAAVETTFNAVRTGRLGARVGNCLAVLCQVQLKAIEGGDLERRLAALEAGAHAAGNGRPNGRAFP
jgi:hypothetical protein